MRMPDITELTERQRDVYLYAPLNEDILVSGPPGTGKTLIAYLRGVYTRKRNIKTVVVMYNRVLTKYTNNVREYEETEELRPSVDTFGRWFSNYWNKLPIPPHPESQVVLQVPRSQKAIPKGCGCRWEPRVWNPFRERCGAWVTDGNNFCKHSAKLEAYEAYKLPPKVEADRFTVDWDAAHDHLLTECQDVNDKNWNWGHLIIDEGQDFSPKMYKALGRISGIITKGHDVPPRITVFADQNQRITTHNSLLSDIRKSLNIDHDRCYILEDNFRNTKQIAQLASHFESGAGTGIARLPQREGPKPELIKAKRREDYLSFVLRFIRNNPEQEIGIITYRDKCRNGIYRYIKGKLKGSNIDVQTYSSYEHSKASEMHFDKKGTITVLNHASCKGLEFDTVFIVEIQQFNIQNDTVDFFKMNLFVAISRARLRIYLMYTDSGTGTPFFLESMPSKDVLKRRQLVPKEKS